jgi:hypothetical protein
MGVVELKMGVGHVPMRMDDIAEVLTGVPRGIGHPVSRSRMRRMPGEVREQKKIARKMSEWRQRSKGLDSTAECTFSWSIVVRSIATKEFHAGHAAGMLAYSANLLHFFSTTIYFGFIVCKRSKIEKNRGNRRAE